MSIVQIKHNKSLQSLVIRFYSKNLIRDIYPVLNNHKSEIVHNWLKQPSNKF